MRRRIGIITASVLAGLAVGAAPAAAVPPMEAHPAYPAAGTCVDTAAALSDAACRKITAVLVADEKATTDEIAVAVVPTTGVESIETWSTGLFDAWGVGKAGKDNGVLLVIAMRDRTLRLVTGDGIRSRLPDGQAGEIVGGTITPFLRQGRTEDAVLAGLDAVRRELGHRVDDTNSLLAPGTAIPSSVADPFAETSDEQDQGFTAGAVLIFVVLGVGLLALALTALRRAGTHAGTATGPAWDPDDDSGFSSSRRRSFSSSSRGSSRSSSRSSSSSRRSGFGGGRSSGGGASGSW